MSVNKNNRYISFTLGLLQLHKLHLHVKYHAIYTLKSARDYWGKLLVFSSKDTLLFCYFIVLYVIWLCYVTVNLMQCNDCTITSVLSFYHVLKPIKIVKPLGFFIERL